MKILAVRTLGALSLLAGCLAPDDVSSSESALTDPDTIDEWNAIADNSIVTVGPTPRPEFQYGAVAAAVYDAANSIDGSYTPLLVHVNADDGASVSAAIAVAAHDMLVGIYPNQKTALDAKLAATLATIPDGASETAGIVVGQKSAAAHLAKWRANGYGIDRPEYYVRAPAGAGVWIPPANLRGSFPWMGHVDPYLVDSIEDYKERQFKVPGPPALDSEEYAAEYNLTKEIGRQVSTVRTPAQTNLGFFWAAEATPRLWNRAIVRLAKDHGLSQLDKARLYAQTLVAGSDATGACWAYKYDIQHWRPVQAITSSFDDGNPATTTDPTWRTLFVAQVVPHPEYPSGHACYTGAVERALQHYFETDEVTFTVTSNGANVTNNTIVYNSFSAATADVNWSRIYLGIHFWSAQEDGTVLGQRVAQNMHARFFKHAH